MTTLLTYEHCVSECMSFMGFKNRHILDRIYNVSAFFWVVCIRILSDPRSLRPYGKTKTNDLTLVTDSSAPLMHQDLNDSGSMTTTQITQNECPMARYDKKKNQCGNFFAMFSRERIANLGLVNSAID